MKKSLYEQPIRMGSSHIPRIKVATVLKTLRQRGYAIDFDTRDIIVLRRIEFPFDRITLPNRGEISIYLLKMYLKDLSIDFQEFCRLAQLQGE